MLFRSIERFDERENVFARRDLQPGTLEYEEFYRRFPELKSMDDALRSRPYIGYKAVPADRGMFYAPAWYMLKIGHPDMVDGAPAEKREPISPERAAAKIKSFARRLGADLVGMTTPYLRPAMESTEACIAAAEEILETIRIAAFLIGAKTFDDLKSTPKLTQRERHDLR